MKKKVKERKWKEKGIKGNDKKKAKKEIDKKKARERNDEKSLNDKKKASERRRPVAFAKICESQFQGII